MNRQIVKYQNFTNKINKYDSLLEQIVSLINSETIDKKKNKETLLEIKKTILSLKNNELLSSPIDVSKFSFDLSDVLNYNLGQFTNLSHIGNGGFGIVLKATHKLDRQSYAIKLIPIKLRLDNNIKIYLLSKIREIRYLSSLSHLNIVRYHNSWLQYCQLNKLMSTLNSEESITDFSNDSNSENSENHNELILYQDCNNCSEELTICLAIQMEYMHYSLKSWSNGIKSSLNKRDIYILLEGLIDGVNYLHTKDPPIIHCDIKPDNILIKREDDKWVAKLADFGLVKELGGIWSAQKHEGTPMYTAPEVSDNYITTQADIYSLGIVLFELTQNFETQMERIICINKFKNGEIITSTILDKMVDKIPQERPLISEVRAYLTNLACK